MSGKIVEKYQIKTSDEKIQSRELGCEKGIQSLVPGEWTGGDIVSLGRLSVDHAPFRGGCDDAYANPDEGIASRDVAGGRLGRIARG